MAKNALITGWGFYAPSRVMTNAELERIVDTSDEWITSRTGIKERRIASDEETNSYMSTRAARAARVDIDDVVSPSDAMRRSRMPVRDVIHSSEVSTMRSSSALVITREGA